MKRLMVSFLYCLMLSIAVATQAFAVPAVTSFTLPIYSNRTVPISSFTVSDNTTLVGYCVTESDNSTPCNWLSAPPASYYLSSGGSKILYAFVKDAAGNISPSVSAMVTASNAILPPPGLLPKTGQTTSYAAGDDGDLQKGVAWPDPRFTDIGDGTVGDNLTGLIWSKVISTPTVGACGGGSEMSWQEALDYVTCLNSTAYLGHSDWLLPNINELKSLLPLPAGHPFTEGQRGNFWSSSSFPSGWATWFVYSSGRTITPDDFPYERYSGYVWPVRGGRWSSSTLSLPKTGQTISYAEGDDGALRRGVAWPYPRFSENGVGTVRDNLTGLIWLKDPSCFGLKIWSDALSNTNLMASGSCGLSDGSVAGDWRMPNRLELSSLIDISQVGPALPAGHPFIIGSKGETWSSTSAYYNYSWNVEINNGFIYLFEFADVYDNLVWPVRGGAWADLTLAVTGDGTGNVTTAGGVPFALSGVSGKETYEQGETVTLQAAPVSGSIFVGWSGACSGPGSCVVTMDSAKEVNANFALDVTKLTVIPNLLSPQRVRATIIFAAAASGGTAEPYEYRFWWRSALAGSKWTVGQAYSPSTTWKWNTARLGLPAGSYFIRVDTRHVGNPVKSEAIKFLTYILLSRSPRPLLP